MNNYKEISEDFNEYLEKLPTGCLKIAEMFREDRVEQGLQNVVNFTEGVNWMIETINLLENEGIKTNIDLSQVNAFLDEIVSGLENTDYYLVADIFEYELVEYFKRLAPITLS